MSKLFYKVCALVWTTNDITMGENIQKHQDAVITEVFGYKEKDFLRNERKPTEVTTWDGKDRALVSHAYLEHMAREIGILGPLAAVYGRDIEQLLMEPNPPTVIPEKFNESIVFGRCPLRAEALKSYQDQSVGSNYSDSDVRSRLSSRRAVSPRRESRR